MAQQETKQAISGQNQQKIQIQSSWLDHRHDQSRSPIALPQSILLQCIPHDPQIQTKRTHIYHWSIQPCTR